MSGDVEQDSTVEQEISKYMEMLRKISWYQMYLIVPTFIIAGLISAYTVYYTHAWQDYATLGLSFVAAIVNYYSAKKSFAKLVRQKLLL